MARYHCPNCGHLCDMGYLDEVLGDYQCDGCKKILVVIDGEEGTYSIEVSNADPEEEEDEGTEWICRKKVEYLLTVTAHEADDALVKAKAALSGDWECVDVDYTAEDADGIVHQDKDED